MNGAGLPLVAVLGLWGCAPTPTPPTNGPRNGAGPDLDCEDVATSTEAQACYRCCRRRGLGDVSDLDRDHDGIACEA